MQKKTKPFLPKTGKENLIEMSRKAKKNCYIKSNTFIKIRSLKFLNQKLKKKNSFDIKCEFKGITKAF